MTLASALVQAPVPGGASDGEDVEMEPSPPHAASLVPIQHKRQMLKDVVERRRQEIREAKRADQRQQEELEQQMQNQLEQDEEERRRWEEEQQDILWEQQQQPAPSPTTQRILNEADAAGADMQQVIFEGQAMFQDMSVNDAMMNDETGHLKRDHGESTGSDGPSLQKTAEKTTRGKRTTGSKKKRSSKK
jgi:hypothetical protein